MQDTQPLPMLQQSKPTMLELRQQCGLSQMQVAQASGVRLCRVAWIENGIESSVVEVLLVLQIYSRTLGIPYKIDDIIGVKVRGR